MKSALWFAFALIPVLLAVALITACIVNASPADRWQLYWAWNKTGPHNDGGQSYNGTLSVSAAAFTFTGDGVTCSGGGVVGGPQMIMDCSGSGWTAQAHGLLSQRQIGFVFQGTGSGMRDGIATSANWVSLAVTG